MMARTILKPAVLAAILGISRVAYAAAGTDAALAHFNAIGAGSLDQLASDYAPDARQCWMGGLFDGVHDGVAAIGATWKQFADAHGAMRVTVEEVREVANAKGSTVIALVDFDAKTSVRVRYVASYRAGKIVSETWQITTPRAPAPG